MPARERLTTGMRIRGSVARRAVFGAGLALIFAAAFCSATTYRASALGETRTLSMYNIHTKETITVTFKRDGKYDPEALKKSACECYGELRAQYQRLRFSCRPEIE